jgi:hypothetical protein
MAQKIDPTNIARQPRGLEPEAKKAKDQAAAGQFAATLGQAAIGAAGLGMTGLQVAAATGLGGGTFGGTLGPILGAVTGMTGMGTSDGASQLQLLNMQRQIQQEAQFFTTLTNIEKAHHDARMSAVRNIRP